ncbi:uncharacterized protein LOC113046750 isoform X2 [Carassius auratus]|nr:uncharacterized protein LOC113046750 isoform X2 [Carassius auratus]
MHGELFTDSEQDWSSSTESDWMSETGKGKGKQGVKRKLNQQNGYKKKMERTKNSSLPGVDLTDIFQEIRKKDQLAVHCGKLAGRLYRIKYDNGEKCISCKGKWFTPSMFEKFGGKGHHKKWKSSIYYNPSNGFQQFKLLELIQNGCLSEFGQLRSNREGTSKGLFSKTLETPICGIEEETIQLDSFSDESITVAERVKMNRRESVIVAETFREKFTEPVESTAIAREPAVSRQLRESIREVTPKESLKIFLSKSLEIPVCRIEEETFQLHRFSDESVSVAEKVKMAQNRKEYVTLPEAVSKKITEWVKSTAKVRDSPAPPTDATEPAVSPVIDEDSQTTDEAGEAAAAQLNFSDSPNDATEPGVSPVIEEADLLHQTTDEAAGEEAVAQLNFSDSPTDATEPGVSPVIDEDSQTTDEAGEAAAAQLNFSDSPNDATEPGVSPVIEEADLLHQTTDEAAGEEAVAQLNFSDSPTDATEPGVSPVIDEDSQTTDEAGEAAAAQLNFSDSPNDATEPGVSPVIEEADLLHQTTDEAAGEEAVAQLNFSDSPTDATEPGVSPVVEEDSQTTDESAGDSAAAQLNFIDSPADATEPEVSPVVEEADLLLHQTTDEAAAAQLNFSDSTAEWQNPDAPKKTKKTEQMQLIQFLENQFNTMNNTLKSIDLSLKKLVENQSQHTPPQYIYLIPADLENTQINSLIKKEPVKEGGGSTEQAEL